MRIRRIWGRDAVVKTRIVSFECIGMNVSRRLKGGSCNEIGWPLMKASEL